MNNLVAIIAGGILILEPTIHMRRAGDPWVIGVLGASISAIPEGAGSASALITTMTNPAMVESQLVAGMNARATDVRFMKKVATISAGSLANIARLRARACAAATS
jgi:hypothetical protein